MPSRKKRKRYRLQQAEATANAPGGARGWGAGYPTTRSDLALLRHAINEDWPVPGNVRLALVREMGNEVATNNVRRLLSVARVLLAMESANFRFKRIEDLRQLLAKRLQHAR